MNTANAHGNYIYTPPTYPGAKTRNITKIEATFSHGTVSVLPKSLFDTLAHLATLSSMQPSSQSMQIRGCPKWGPRAKVGPAKRFHLARRFPLAKQILIFKKILSYELLFVLNAF